MKIYLTFLCCICFVFSKAQGRLVLNGAYLRIANGTSGGPAYLVIDNNNPNAITRTSNGGLIISEGEFNKIKWNIGTAMTDSAAYWFHLGTSTGLAWIPFRLVKTTAGTGSGVVTVSSWYTAANATVPSGGYSVCPSENSAIDRFWVIDVSGYTTNPSCDIRFYYYDNATELDGIAEGDLQVQHGNLSLSCPWDPPMGTADAASNFVQVNGISSFSPFTLGNRNSPLPVELLSFTGKCADEKIELAWETASETNNSFFTPERSTDGRIFESIGTVQGTGNSNSATAYDFTDPGIPGSVSDPLFYRLKQTDFDGSFSYSGLIAVSNCKINNDNILIFFGANDEIILSVNSSSAKRYDLFFYDSSGRRIHSEVFNVSEGDNARILSPKKFASGIYMMALQNDSEVITKKIFLH